MSDNNSASERAEKGLLEMLASGQSAKDIHDECRAMMAQRDLWTDEMRETHARRKAAMDVCVSVLVNLNDEDRYIVRDRLLDLFDLADGKLEPSDVSPW